MVERALNLGSKGSGFAIYFVYLGLSEPQFSHLENGNNKTVPLAASWGDCEIQMQVSEPSSNVKCSTQVPLGQEEYHCQALG